MPQLHGMYLLNKSLGIGRMQENSSTFQIPWIPPNMTDLWAKINGNVDTFTATEKSTLAV